MSVFLFYIRNTLAVCF